MTGRLLKSFFGWLPSILRVIFAGTVGTTPLIGNKFHIVALAWPPVGSIDNVANIAIGVIVAIGWLPTLFRKKTTAKTWGILGLIITFAGLMIYGYLHSIYVVKLPTPHDGIQYRTIGRQRTELALQPRFSKLSNQDLLKIAGLEDGDIERMWTAASVERARLELFISYVVCLASFNLAVCSLARASIELRPRRRGERQASPA